MSTVEFNNMVIQYTNPLFGFAKNLTKDHNDANDLLQETRLKAIKYKDKFKEGTNIKAWLFTIMKNTFINNYRKKKKKNTMFDATPNDYFINSTDHTVDNAGVSDVKLEEIHKAVQNLPEEYRIPFMSYFEGYKYQEIADELNLPLGTVKSRIFLARKELKESLHEYKQSYA